MLIFVLVFILEPKYFLALCLMLAILLTGPIIQLASKADVSFFIADFSYVYKMLMPISIFIYFGLLAVKWKKFTAIWLERILLSNFVLLCLNLFLGAMGFGRASYSLRDGETAGSNGFIYAANELGGTMIVLFSFTLHLCWNYKPRWYLFFSLFTVLCGLLVATKTAMLATLILIFLIPIANERERFFNFTKLKCITFIPMLVSISVVIFLITDLLQALGLYDRFLWILTDKGVLGVIWSGREVYVRDLLVVYIENLDFWQQFFGVGTAGVAQYLPVKYSAEVDFIDTIVWFGFPGLAISLGFYIFTLLKAAKQFTYSDSKYSPCVFVGGIILLFLSQLSGHIWMSGTLGISLGCFLSLLWVDKRQRR
nr:O-antigen ligase family protein [Pseudoalteromonas sp. TB64]